jgi:hypothetical protein
MAAYCGKHDIVYSEGGVCWCCEQAKTKPQPTAVVQSQPQTRVIARG